MIHYQRDQNAVTDFILFDYQWKIHTMYGTKKITQNESKPTTYKNTQYFPQISLFKEPPRREGPTTTSVTARVRMIFDLIDLFDRNPFRLIKSNHFLSMDCIYLWEKVHNLVDFR